MTLCESTAVGFTAVGFTAVGFTAVGFTAVGFTVAVSAALRQSWQQLIRSARLMPIF